MAELSRIPHGMRGLKSDVPDLDTRCSALSHPAWDAWIEIKAPAGTTWKLRVASRMGCVD